MITLDMESVGNYMLFIISSLWNSCNEVYLEAAFVTLLTLSLTITIYIMWKRNNSTPVEGIVSSENAPFNSDCPVCLDELTDGAESSCGHLFCGSCIKQLIERRAFRRLFICPVCRQKVHLLYEYFPNGSSDENAELRSDITRYNNFSLLTFPQNVRFFCKVSIHRDEIPDYLEPDDELPDNFELYT